MNNEYIQNWWARFKKPVLITTGIIVAYALIGFLLIPAVLEWQMPKQIKEHTGRDSSIQKVEFNPFALSMSLQGFEIQEQNSDRFVAFDEFFVNFQPWASLFTLTWTLDEVRLTKPYTQVAVLGEEQFNFSDMAKGDKKEQPEESEGGIPPVLIHRLQIQEGQFLFQDQTHPTLFESKLIPINLDLNEFTTVLDKDSPHQLSAELGGGGKLDWTGNITVNPLRSVGKLSLSKIQARPLWEYIQDKAHFEIQSGAMDLNLNYQMDGSTDTLQLQIAEGAFQLNQLVITEKGQKTALLDIPKFTIDGIAVNLAEQTVVVNSVSSEAAKFRTWLSKEGTFNYASLFTVDSDPQAQPASAAVPADNDADSAPWKVLVKDIALNQYALNFQDRGPEQPMTLDLTPLTIKVQNYSTEPGSKLTLGLDSTVNKTGKIGIHGDLAIDPMATELDLELSQIALDTFYPYAAAALQQLKGTLNLKGKLLFSNNAQDKPVVDYDGGLNIDKLHTVMEGMDIASDAITLQGKLGFTMDNDNKPRLSYDGGLGVKQLATKMEAMDLSTEDISLQGKLAFKNDHNDQPKLDYDGSVGIKQLVTKMDGLDLSTGDITLKGVLAFNNDVNAKPIVDYDGSVDIGTLKTTVKPFKISSKLIHAEGKSTYQGGDAKKPMLKFNGQSHITDFRTANLRSRKDVARWKKLSLKNLEFEHEPMRVSLAEVVLDRLYAKVVIEKDGSLNLTAEDQKDKPKTEDKPKPETKKSAAKEKQIPIKIGAVKIKNGSLNFADRSLTPNFAIGIQKLNGSVKGLSSNRKAKAVIDIKGQVDKHAPVTIAGHINPFSTEANTDIKIQFKNISLTSVTPYSGKFAGYKIEKGKLSMDLRYQLDNRKLKADNKIVIDQLTLGEKVDSPDATSLPIGLAIGLMKDANGKIDLDLPISGSLDDPTFSIWGLVGKAVMNLLTKAIASPFALIGGLAGGGGEELSFVSFPAGVAKMNEAQAGKLVQVAAALQKRPQLKIEIKGLFASEEDRAALAEKAVMEILKQEEGDEDNPEIGDTIPMENEDYVDELEDLYEDLFDDQDDILDADKALKKTDPEAWAKTIKKRVIEKQTVDESALRLLAQARAKAIETHLIQQGQLAGERIFLLDVAGEAEADADGVKIKLSLTGS